LPGAAAALHVWFVAFAGEYSVPFFTQYAPAVPALAAPANVTSCVQV
jgi:hypothetical protein